MQLSQSNFKRLMPMTFDQLDTLWNRVLDAKYDYRTPHDCRMLERCENMQEQISIAEGLKRNRDIIEGIRI